MKTHFVPSAFIMRVCVVCERWAVCCVPYSPFEIPTFRIQVRCTTTFTLKTYEQRPAYGERWYRKNPCHRFVIYANLRTEISLIVIYAHTVQIILNYSSGIWINILFETYTALFRPPAQTQTPSCGEHFHTNLLTKSNTQPFWFRFDSQRKNIYLKKRRRTKSGMDSHTGGVRQTHWQLLESIFKIGKIQKRKCFHIKALYTYYLMFGLNKIYAFLYLFSGENENENHRIWVA